MLNKDLISHLTNCKVHSTVKQEDDEKGWLAARTKGIGGSDIGAICGVSPFTSARQIYFKKTGQYQDSVEPGTAAIDRMHFGHLLEPIVADEFARRTGLKIVSVDATFVHKDYPWALANVDRLVVDADEKPIAILECKTTSEYMNSEWEEGDILESYIYQLNWYMWILGIPRGYFACLVGGNKFYHYEVVMNEDLVYNTLIPAAKEFWEHNVANLVAPEMQQTDTELANNMYSDVKKKSEIFIEDEAANDLAATVVECKAKIKELTATMEEAQNRLKDRLQDNEIGYTTDYTIKWSPRSQKRVDSTLLKATYPEIYEKCLKTTTFRVMQIKGGQ